MTGSLVCTTMVKSSQTYDCVKFCTNTETPKSTVCVPLLGNPVCFRATLTVMKLSHFLTCAALAGSFGFVGVAQSDNSLLQSRAMLPTIEKIVAYNDQDYGFQLAVPEQWSRIYAAEDDADADALEPGYAVGFESPRTSQHDVFADYLMVEILPGAHTGAFESDGSSTKVVMVDGKVAITDQVQLNGFDINGEEIDLIVFQAEIVELGFTVGLFAIGEQREAQVLQDAFELMLKTFQIPEDPFSVS